MLISQNKTSFIANDTFYIIYFNLWCFISHLGNLGLLDLDVTIDAFYYYGSDTRLHTTICAYDYQTTETSFFFWTQWTLVSTTAVIPRQSEELA